MATSALCACMQLRSMDGDIGTLDGNRVGSMRSDKILKYTLRSIPNKIYKIKLSL